MNKRNVLPASLAEAIAQDLAEVADDEEVRFDEQKARAIISRRVKDVGIWEVHWSAKEVLPLINRLRQAEARLKEAGLDAE